MNSTSSLQREESFQQWFARVGSQVKREYSRSRSVSFFDTDLSFPSWIPEEVLTWLHTSPDLWRVINTDFQYSVPMKTGLGSIIPRLTNGVLVMGQLVKDESWFLAHRTNMPDDWGKLFLADFNKPKKQKEPKPKKEKKAKVLTVDADSILDF